MSTELITILAALVGIVVLVKVGMTYLRNIYRTTGYNPLGFLNIVLLIGIFGLAITGVYLLSVSNTLLAILAFLSSAGCMTGLIVRNIILKKPGRVILVTFFQLFAPALTIIGILYKRSGGIMGNAATQANLSGTTTNSSNSGQGAFAGFGAKQNVKQVFTSSQEQLAQSEGFLNAEDAKQKGFDSSQYI